ncbi:MAG: preprotein translocase subunit YajC [Acidobacterium ailaaui]|jgi:preprotein translocase subunit YajC|nr:preprotein translocase subunit YajC [Pseudacidobacterium ailaaui]MCL6463215.1 preprotein translocase subunit YajC [Pseudacidobacterium ailaaui]
MRPFLLKSYKTRVSLHSSSVVPGSREPFVFLEEAACSPVLPNFLFPGYNHDFSLCKDVVLCHEKDCSLTPNLLLAAALPPGLVTFLPFVVIIAVFYLLLIRPQQARQKQWQQMLHNLKPGDRVTTSGGIRGTILSIKDDAIQLRVPPDNIKMEVVKSAIASVTTDEPAK